MVIKKPKQKKKKQAMEKFKFAPYFKETYSAKLNSPNGSNPLRERASGFQKIFELLDDKDKSSYEIIETGTIRRTHGELNFGGDGCSTVIFDDFISKKHGVFISVDLDKDNCEYAKSVVKSPSTGIINSDSVNYIHNKLPDWFLPDLVYLDSFDVVQHRYIDSAIHHLKELASLMPHLRKEAIIAVDDHDAFFDGGLTGKGVLVKEYLINVGCRIIYEGYQLIGIF